MAVKWPCCSCWSVVASDTLQYYTGRALGRRKLAPVISPKKTVEGAVGGFVGATLVMAFAGRGVAAGRAAPRARRARPRRSPASASSAISFESMLKRAADVKDSSTPDSRAWRRARSHRRAAAAAPVYIAFLKFGAVAGDMKRIAILGSTGSIGTSALSVADAHPDRLRVVALAAGRTRRGAGGADHALPSGDRGARERRAIVRRSRAPPRARGTTLVARAATGWWPSPRIPTSTSCCAPRRARRRSKRCSPRSTAGKTHRARQQGSARDGRRARDREPRARAASRCCRSTASTTRSTSACTAAGPTRSRRLILTASGGPFRTWPAAKLDDVTPEDALRHPTWQMGREDHDRLGHADEQGPRGDRGALAVRRAGRSDRRGRAPAVDRALDGRAERRLDDRAARRHRHAAAHPVRVLVSGSLGRGASRARSDAQRRARVRVARISTAFRACAWPTRPCGPAGRWRWC